MNELEMTVRDDMNATAHQYESQKGHGLNTPEEGKAWRDDVLERVNFKPGSICLDVAAGTGVLTRQLANWVGTTGHVVATDFAQDALSLNKKRLPKDIEERVSFLTGDAADAKLLSASTHKSFDFITCRQGVVLFRDPLSVFRNWFNWLIEGGRVVILDALWSRESWEGPYAPMVDELPLSCLGSLETIPYLLTQAGFSIETKSFMHRVNAHLSQDPDPNLKPPRFIVVAIKHSS